MDLRQKILFFILISLLYGCSEQNFKDDLLIFIKKPIIFSPNINVEEETRGLPVTSANGIQSVIVYAYYTGNGNDSTWADYGVNTVPNFFNAQTLTNSGYNTGTNKWEYSPILYWPSNTNANITFFAYSPAASDTNGITVSETTGGLSLKYTAPENCSDQPDLMMSLPAKDLNGADNSFVDLSMKHMLTSICFSAIGTIEEIESITVKNIIVSGTLSYDSTGDSLKWDLDDAVTKSYNPTLNDTILYDNYVPIISSNGYLLLPPQTLPDGAEITVTTKSDTIKTYDVSGMIWKAGQQINYKLDLIISPSNISVEAIQTSYVGAYWRYNETGERIIRMNSTGDWAASVISTDSSWDYSDILIDYLPSDYNTTIGTLIDGDILQMDSKIGRAHV